MDYKVVGTCVIEVKTNNIIRVCKNSNDAKKRAKDLNNNCGFRGWTPEFLLKSSS